MTDSDDKLLQRYRALPREEPPRALDDTILAASRRAVAMPPASRSWAGPVSIAAVLVLAFGVTLEMQREEPGIEHKETAKPTPPAAPTVSSAPSTLGATADRLVPESVPIAGKQAALELRRESPPPRKIPPGTKEAAPLAKEADRLPEAFATSPPQAQSMPAAGPAPMETARDANVATMPAAPPPASAAMAAPRAKTMANSSGAKAEMAEMADAAPARTLAPPSEPERELERIAKLRDEGRNAEADKALEEFRRKLPAFRIPDAMWPRVKPR